jgi:hypothetical protein
VCTSTCQCYLRRMAADTWTHSIVTSDLQPVPDIPVAEYLFLALSIRKLYKEEVQEVVFYLPSLLLSEKHTYRLILAVARNR